MLVAMGCLVHGSALSRFYTSALPDCCLHYVCYIPALPVLCYFFSSPLSTGWNVYHFNPRVLYFSRVSCLSSRHGTQWSSGGLLFKPLLRARASFTGRSVFSGPCSGTFSISPRTEVSQLFWAVGLLHQVGWSFFITLNDWCWSRF